MGPGLILERKGRTRVRPLLSVYALLIPRCLIHHYNSFLVVLYFALFSKQQRKN